MSSIKELADRLKNLGRVHVLDLGEAAFQRGIYQVALHEGMYYLLPPDGTNASELQKIFDEYKAQDVLHLSYNAQSSIDMSHKPLLPLDSYANRFFSHTPEGVIKLNIVAKSKLEEFHAILDAFRRPFDAGEFPGVNEVRLSEFKPTMPHRQTVVRLVLLQPDFKVLTHLEDAIKEHLASNNLLREISVSRPSVRGLQPEVVLCSTEDTGDFANQFLTDLAHYLQDNKRAEGAVSVRAPVQEHEDTPEPDFSMFHRKEPVKHVGSVDLYKNVLNTFAATLPSMKEFSDAKPTVTGKLLLLEMPKRGLLGIGGHFSPDHAKTLSAVYQVVRGSPGLSEGWKAYYHYDKGTRMLSISATNEEERPPSGWTPIS